jgi:hypothetical protein
MRIRYNYLLGPGDKKPLLLIVERVRFTVFIGGGLKRLVPLRGLSVLDDCILMLLYIVKFMLALGV